MIPAKSIASHRKANMGCQRRATKFHLLILTLIAAGHTRLERNALGCDAAMRPVLALSQRIVYLLRACKQRIPAAAWNIMQPLDLVSPDQLRMNHNGRVCRKNYYLCVQVVRLLEKSRMFRTDLVITFRRQNRGQYAKTDRPCTQGLSEI